MFLKWAARVVALALLVVADGMLKEITEAHDIESGIVGTYRAIALLLVYYIFWVFTRRFGGVTESTAQPKDQETLSSLAVATFALYVCIAIAIGFLAAHFAYVSAIDQSAGERAALVLGLVTYMAGAGTVLWTLDRITKATS